MSRAGYDARKYTLNAGEPVTLPTASQYVLISASRGDGLINSLAISIGDANAAYSTWPFGIAIKCALDQSARVISTIDQTVVIAFSIGDTQISDSRAFPTYPRPSVKRFFANAGSPSVPYTQIFDGLLNTAGVVISSLHWRWMFGAVTGSIDAFMSSSGESEGFHSAYEQIGATATVNVAAERSYFKPIIIPPGQDLGYTLNNAGTLRWSLEVLYSFLFEAPTQ